MIRQMITRMFGRTPSATVPQETSTPSWVGTIPGVTMIDSDGDPIPMPPALSPVPSAPTYGSMNEYHFAQAQKYSRYPRAHRFLSS